MNESETEPPVEEPTSFHDQIAAVAPKATYAPREHKGAPPLPWYVTMFAPKRLSRGKDER